MSSKVAKALQAFTSSVYRLTEMVANEERAIRDNPLSVVPPFNPEITKAAVASRQAAIDLERVCSEVKPPGPCLIRMIRLALRFSDFIGTTNSADNNVYNVGYKVGLAHALDHVCGDIYNTVYYAYLD